MEQVTLGSLTEWRPPTKEEAFFNNVVQILDEVFPDNWRAWVINIPSYNELFREHISSDLECRLRFAIPTIRLAKAYSTETTLSERRYKKIKRILLTWPLGRALIYAPLTIAAKVHPVQAYNKFSETVNMIKALLISRQEASEILKKEVDIDTSSNSNSSRATKRSHSPESLAPSKEPRIKFVPDLPCPLPRARPVCSVVTERACSSVVCGVILREIPNFRLSIK
ncbi:hypothetical protein B5X24_HaOG213163 [Helicoverpa armigera]|uniref:Uncharacterized protein n=1 Tax=Helicoverpa armigera TaxID=29058 RepID=A0A2W1B5Z3_HELAM|nr:hypothetical protein B5X24_HaOG213163 [Helicoverpa armigera]